LTKFNTFSYFLAQFFSTFKVTEKNDKSAIITCTTLRNDNVSSTSSKCRFHEKKEKCQSSFRCYLWPPNSPDLNPVDYSVWSILQEKVYKTRVTDLDDLKHHIRTELSWITPSLLQLCVSGVVVFQLVSGRAVVISSTAFSSDSVFLR